jgi:hypothetical protein
MMKHDEPWTFWVLCLHTNPSIAALSCEVEKARLESTHLKKIIGLGRKDVG